MPTRNYYLQRNMAASEILRLVAQGINIHQAAQDWAKASASTKPTGHPPNMTRRSKVLEILQGCDTSGLMTRHFAAALKIGTRPTSALLCKMVDAGQAFAVKVGTFVHYFPTAERAEAGRVHLVKVAAAQREAYLEKERTRKRTGRAAAPAPRPMRERKRRAPPAPPPAPAARQTPVLMAPDTKHTFAFYSEKKQPKQPKKVEIIGLKEAEVQTCPPCQVERFKVTELPADGFVAEWKARRAGGSA